MATHARAPAEASPAAPACPVTRALGMLQAKWTLHIVRALLDGPKGFNELARALGGCNPVTLSQRLDGLVAAGLVERRAERAGPRRACYRLTDAGRALEEVLAAIEAWARRYPPPA
jgi:DNA-binding HxlR family transcriptional regulator